MIKFFIYVLMVVLLGCNSHGISNKKTTTAPKVASCGKKFCINDCVRMVPTRQREPWEEQGPTSLIREIGYKAYRAVYWLETMTKWGPDKYSHTITFNSEEYYEKVICPQ